MNVQLEELLRTYDDVPSESCSNPKVAFVLSAHVVVRFYYYRAYAHGCLILTLILSEGI